MIADSVFAACIVGGTNHPEFGAAPYVTLTLDARFIVGASNGLARSAVASVEDGGAGSERGPFILRPHESHQLVDGIRGGDTTPSRVSRFSAVQIGHKEYRDSPTTPRPP